MTSFLILTLTGAGDHGLILTLNLTDASDKCCRPWLHFMPLNLTGAADHGLILCLLIWQVLQTMASLTTASFSIKDLSVIGNPTGLNMGKLVWLNVCRCCFPPSCKKTTVLCAENLPNDCVQKCSNWYVWENLRNQVLRPQSFRGSQQGYNTVTVWWIFC